MQLTKQKILLTGGGTGIGLAFTRALAARDNAIVIAGRRLEPLEAAAAGLSGVTPVTADLVDEASVRALVEFTERRLGGLTVLINNAGIQYNDEYATADPDEVCQHVDREIGTNLTGLIKLTALALPMIRRSVEGAIVNVSSILAISPKRSAPVYCATKAAVRSFTQALRYQLREQAPHVGVFEVLPPIVATPMTEGRGPRKLEPEQVASATIHAIERGRPEIPVGKTRLVQWLHRAFPGAVEARLRQR